MGATGGGGADRAANSLIGFAASARSPNGLLEPVLAEGCEVDREVDGVGQAVG